MVKSRDRQCWRESFVECEDATFWHEPEEFDRDDSWSDDYLEPHHVLEPVDEIPARTLMLAAN